MQYLALVAIVLTIIGLSDDDRYTVKPEYNLRAAGTWWIFTAGLALWALAIATLLD